MNRYANYCTEEQAKKALELGAPIKLWSEYHKCQEHDFKLDTPIPCEQFTNGYTTASCPTTEQMIGWLADKKIFVHINPISDICYTWYISSKGYNKYGYTSDIKMRNTNKQACLDAIDVALEYLERWKK